MNRYQVTFKSGAQIEFDADELHLEKGFVNTASLIAARWNTGDGHRRLMYLALDNIEAVVEMRD